jgi:hypothetical protein
MRSAAAGEHRTGEERLDGIAPGPCDPAGEMGDRCAVSRRLVRSGVEAGGCVPSPFTFARESADFTQRSSGQAKRRGRADGRPGRPGGQAAARSAARRGGVRDGSPQGRDRAAGSMRSTRAKVMDNTNENGNVQRPRRERTARSSTAPPPPCFSRDAPQWAEPRSGPPRAANGDLARAPGNQSRLNQSKPSEPEKKRAS